MSEGKEAVEKLAFYTAFEALNLLMELDPEKESPEGKLLKALAEALRAYESTFPFGLG